MRKFTDHCLPPTCPSTFGDIYNRKPPLNIIEALGTAGTISLYASLAATAASTAISYSAQQTAAKQAKYNAEAESQALANEQKQKELEFSENQRRLAEDQRRFRAKQLAAIADSGIVAGVGTALQLEADTWKQNNTDLTDAGIVNQINSSNLNYRAGAALQLGKAESAGYKRAATGTLVSGLGSMVGTIGGAYTSPYKAPASKSSVTVGPMTSSVTSSGK